MPPVAFEYEAPDEAKDAARRLPYLLRELPVAPAERRWIAWTPKLPNPYRHAYGRTPLRALFAAHRAARAGLAAHPDVAPREPEHQRAYRRRLFTDPLVLVTGRRADDPDAHPELVPFAVLAAQQLDPKEASGALGRRPMPTVWNTWVARHLDPNPTPAYGVTVLAAAAADPELPEDALWALADKGLAAQVLRHPAVTRTLVERFARDTRLRPEAIAHPLLRVATLRAIYDAIDPHGVGPEKAVLKGIARHPRCPPDIVEVLSRHPDLYVREAVALRRSLPLAIRNRLADDDLERVRAALATVCRKQVGRGSRARRRKS